MHPETPEETTLDAPRGAPLVRVLGLAAASARWRPLLAGSLWIWASLASAETDDAVLWPEHQRAFFQDGPALLLSDGDRRAFAAMAEAGRDDFMEEFLRDPLPDSEVNELRAGIDRRLRLVRSEVATPLDDRARLLFLHGAPAARQEIDCGTTLVPLEIWSYPDTEFEMLLYKPPGRHAYRLWRPHDGKRVLYSDLMEGWFAELEDFGMEKERLDIRRCAAVVTVDRVTRTAGLFDEQPDLVLTRAIDRQLSAPEDLAAWSSKAAATPLGAEAAELESVDVKVGFPFRVGQRIAARFVVFIEDAASLGVQELENGESEIALEVSGLLEQNGELFEDFKVRFKQPVPEVGSPVVLVWDRRLRPGRSFLARLQVRDTISGGSAHLVQRVAVPREVERVVAGSGLVVPAEEVAGVQLAGVDSVVLVPPVTDGLSKAWRAEAIVAGERIAKVVFSVDGEQQLVKTRPPYTADLRLADLPVEQTVTVLGLDREGETVDVDSVLLNRARGLFEVRILSPVAGDPVEGELMARAEVSVPDEARLAAVEFSVNDEIVATLSTPPWEAPIRVDPTGQVSFLTVVAHLDSGMRAEDLVFLNAPARLDRRFGTIRGGSGRRRFPGPGGGRGAPDRAL
jgi:hypothetical protein